MKFNPYEDSKRLEQQILVNDDLGRKPSETAKNLGVSPQRVSYFLAKHGRSRPKIPKRGSIPMCVVCRNKPAVPMFVHICSDPGCVFIFNHTAACTGSIMGNLNGKITRLSSDEKMLLEIMPAARGEGIHFPKTAEVCMLNDVTKVLSSVADHIRYHAYLMYEYAGTKRPKPPAILWRNKSEQEAYKIRQRDIDFARRNANSEQPQPRYARKWKHDHYSGYK